MMMSNENKYTQNRMDLGKNKQNKQKTKTKMLDMIDVTKRS